VISSSIIISCSIVIYTSIICWLEVGNILNPYIDISEILVIKRHNFSDLNINICIIKNQNKILLILNIILLLYWILKDEAILTINLHFLLIIKNVLVMHNKYPRIMVIIVAIISLLHVYFSTLFLLDFFRYLIIYQL
jgi:hypothetical protein